MSTRAAEGARGAGQAPCSGLRVLDLGSGPVSGVATMVLSDFGADVIAIERPGGDPWRRAPASEVWLRGKRSVTLDLRSEEGRARLRALAATADVAVAAAAPGTALRLGCRLRLPRGGEPRPGVLLDHRLRAGGAARGVPRTRERRRRARRSHADPLRHRRPGGADLRGRPGRAPRRGAGRRGGHPGRPHRARALGPGPARGDEPAAGDPPLRHPRAPAEAAGAPGPRDLRSRDGPRGDRPAAAAPLPAGAGGRRALDPARQPHRAALPLLPARHGTLRARIAAALRRAAERLRARAQGGAAARDAAANAGAGLRRVDG